MSEGYSAGYISPKTAEYHVSVVLAKPGARRRGQAAALAAAGVLRQP